MINLVARLTATVSKLLQCTDYKISLLMARKSLMTRTLVMAEEMDDQELLLVANNKTGL